MKGQLKLEIMPQDVPGLRHRMAEWTAQHRSRPNEDIAQDCSFPMRSNWCCGSFRSEGSHLCFPEKKNPQRSESQEGQEVGTRDKAGPSLPGQEGSGGGGRLTDGLVVHTCGDRWKLMASPGPTDTKRSVLSSPPSALL